MGKKIINQEDYRTPELSVPEGEQVIPHSEIKDKYNIPQSLAVISEEEKALRINNYFFFRVTIFER